MAFVPIGQPMVLVEIVSFLWVNGDQLIGSMK